MLVAVFVSVAVDVTVEVATGKVAVQVAELAGVCVAVNVMVAVGKTVIVLVTEYVGEFVKLGVCENDNVGFNVEVYVKVGVNVGEFPVQNWLNFVYIASRSGSLPAAI